MTKEVVVGMRFASENDDSSNVVDTTLEACRGATLVVPSVSIGNCGQLAVDLLLQTMRGARMGYLQSPHVIPMVGNDAFAMGPSGTLVTPLELFRLPSNAGIFVIQQRSPLLKGRLGAFSDDMVAWARACKFAKIVVVGSGDAAERTAGQIEGSQLWFACSGKGKATEHVPVAGEWLELQERDTSPMQDKSGPFKLHVPGSGFAFLIHDRLKNALDMACVVLIRFCSEGDNTRDAHSLASKVNALLALQPEPVRWEAPVSWRHLFGSGANMRLY